MFNVQSSMFEVTYVIHSYSVVINSIFIVKKLSGWQVNKAKSDEQRA